MRWKQQAVEVDDGAVLGLDLAGTARSERRVVVPDAPEPTLL